MLRRRASRMVSDGSGTIVPSVTRWIRPSPWHSGHAPTAVLGEKASESSRSVARADSVPAREKSIRSRLDRVVTVPTVDRDVAEPRCCCNATAGGSPVMSSTLGAPVGNSSAGHTERPIRSSGAGPRHRWSRRPTTICRIRRPR